MLTEFNDSVTLVNSSFEDPCESVRSVQVRAIRAIRVGPCESVWVRAIRAQSVRAVRVRASPCNPCQSVQSVRVFAVSGGESTQPMRGYNHFSDSVLCLIQGHSPTPTHLHWLHLGAVQGSRDGALTTETGSEGTTF